MGNKDRREYLDAWYAANWKLLGRYDKPAQVVLRDLDSTVCRTMHRRPMIEQIRAGQSTWEDYSMACGEDTPILQNCMLMWAMPNYTHIALSGRSSAALGLTRDWCQRHHIPLSGFLLRQADDHMPNGEWKVLAIRFLQEKGALLQFMVEDWQAVAEYITDQTSLPVVCVNPLDPEESRAAADGHNAISQSF